MSAEYKEIEGFSKLSKKDKLKWVAQNYFDDPKEAVADYKKYWNEDKELQKQFDEFSENTLTNFYMPYGVAPNFLINGRIYTVPMVIEESSVVAAACKAAKYWRDKGGFNAEIIDTEKIGQVHFIWKGTDKEKLERFVSHLKPILRKEAQPITNNMDKRGGGILDVELVDMTQHIDNYYQLKGTFETCDSMGANFINSVLESFASVLRQEAMLYKEFEGEEKDVEVIMSILSNYTPRCLVRVWVECPIEKLGTFADGTMGPQIFAERFARGVKIAEVDPHRATTHNKGIFNGIDSVILATGNDFRAVEACGHTYASRTGQYSSLTHVDITDGHFKFSMDIPLALGTVGGLTGLHPLVKRSLELLGNPSAQELMKIAAAVGLASNFSAIRSLVTVGIQRGHMKMHLLNILKTLEANKEEIEKAKVYFINNVVSYNTVREFLYLYRSGKLDDKKA